MNPGAAVHDDQTFLRQFEAGTFPLDQWHHRQHIKVAYLYLCAHPFEVAIERMRTGIRALNAAHAVPDELTRGYHENDDTSLDAPGRDHALRIWPGEQRR